MNTGEIAERFILAAETERKMPRSGERPQGYGGYVLPWVHTLADINSRRRTGESGEKLMSGDDPLEEWEKKWMDEWDKHPTAADVTAWEECMRWTAEILTNEAERRALWAWAFSKAGGRSFSRWCRETEHIHRETGSKRKNRALDKISAHLLRSDTQHCKTGTSDGLQVAPEIGHVSSRLDEEPGQRTDPNFTGTDAAFKSFLNLYKRDRDGRVTVEPEGFSWRAGRNERRRQRRKEAA